MCFKYIRLRSLEGTAVEISSLTPIPTDDEIEAKVQKKKTSDIAIAAFLGCEGWELISVVALISGDNYDKELWFKKSVSGFEA